MHRITRDRKAAAWDMYEVSVLDHLLCHDTWHANVGLPLICGIDPKNSRLHMPQHLQGIIDHLDVQPEDIDQPCYETIVLLSEDSRYCLAPNSCPEGSDVGNAVDFLDSCGIEFERDIELIYADISARLRKRSLAAQSLARNWQIFVSNPDHVKNPIREPKYFVKWALAKFIEIPWLDWAVEFEYLSLSKKNKLPATPIKKTPKTNAPERQIEKGQEISELRERAKKVGIKLKRDGIQPKHITVNRICEDLLNERFSNGKSFESRWASVEGMRAHLKGEHHPTKNKEFRNAKSTRGKFNN